MKARATGLPQFARRHEKALRGAVDLATAPTQPDAIVVCGSIVTASRTGAAPDAGTLLAAALRDNDLAGKLRMAERLAGRLLGARGFFDRVGPREHATSSGL